MGWLILVGVLGLIGYALYVWSGNSDSVDDREDGGWSFFERKSGPFYWRKRWMGKDKLEEKAKASIKRGIEDADAGRLIPYEEIKDRLDKLEQLYTEKIDSIQFTEWEDATLNDGLVDDDSLGLIWDATEGNIRVKQKHNDWDDTLSTEPRYDIDSRRIGTMHIEKQALIKALADIDKRLKVLEDDTLPNDEEGQPNIFITLRFDDGTEWNEAATCKGPYEGCAGDDIEFRYETRVIPLALLTKRFDEKKDE